jgi:metal-responsive CopG/Arc/MetJ family transcriptional regulator
VAKVASSERTTRLTISLPSDLVATVERELLQPDESRSAFFRRLLEEALREAEERKNVERYIVGYREQPRTEEEFGWSEAVAVEALANVRWDE